MADKKEPFAFEPILFDKCPACSSTERVAKTAWDEEVAKGKIPPGITPAVVTTSLPLADMRANPPPFFSVLICHYDVCLNCGTMYCWRVERKSGNIVLPGGMPRRGPMGGAPVG